MDDKRGSRAHAATQSDHAFEQASRDDTADARLRSQSLRSAV